MNKIIKFIDFMENKRLNNAYWFPGRRLINYNDYNLVPSNKITKVLLVLSDIIFLIISSIILSCFLILLMSCIAVVFRCVFFKRIRIKKDAIFDMYLEGNFFNPSISLYNYLEGRLFQEFLQKKMEIEIGIDNGQTSRLHFSGKKFAIGTEYSVLWRESNLIGDKDLWKYKIICDICALPFKSESFRSIASVHVLDHVKKYETALREISRVLKPGGTIILSTFSINYVTLNLRSIFYSIISKKTKVLEDARKKAEKGIYYNFYSRNEWQQSLARCGLKVDEFKTFINGPVKYIWCFLQQPPLRKNGFLPFQYWLMYKFPGHTFIKAYWKWTNYSILHISTVFSEGYRNGPQLFMKITKENK